MAAEQGRELRRLAKSHRISFKPPLSSEQEWPSRYRNCFKNIKKIGAYTYEHYVASIDPHSDQQPWRERTKFRANWLTKKAGNLSQQQRNEAGWRFGIENDVFRRFGFEVACPECRARLWRSEVEAAVDPFKNLSREIIKRRKNRKPCQCPPEKRPQDSYEVGTNPLFDDRVQEIVLHNPLLSCNLPKQEPDRVYGLRETNNFKDLFCSSTVQSSNPQRKKLGEFIRSSPFKDVSDPLLFPFLILEAKSEKSSNGFDDISIQTAFPILALLKLQEGLARQVNDTKLDDGGPLVWFFANRGDAWRVYGCFVTEEHPAGYNIMQLWEGSILFHDKALQLLLIVDYVFDWARDVYRPSILRQLKSLTRTDPYDQISLANDSDIYSMRGQISSWIQPPKTTIDLTRMDVIDLTREEFDPLPRISKPEPTSDYERMLLELSEECTYGTASCFRSPNAVTSRITGLYLTEANTRSLLQWAGANDFNKNETRSVCRTLVSFVAQWDELLLLSKEQLLNLEALWTESSCPEKMPAENDTTNVLDTYVLLEYATYMDVSWRIVREMTYLAISKEAFEFLVDYADFTKKHDGVSSISECLRPCSTDILAEAVGCLRSGSVHQTFLEAVSCSCYALFLLQASENETLKPHMGLEKLPHSRLRGIVAKYHAYCQPHISKSTHSGTSKRQKIETPYKDLGNESYPPDRSFVRLRENKNDISANRGHDHTICKRCCPSGTKIFPYPKIEGSSFTKSGMALVTALTFDEDKDGSPLFCLFAQEMPPEIDTSSPQRMFRSELKLAKILEDMSKSDKIYHTLQHPLPKSFAKASSHYEVRWHSVIWNLPIQMHPLDSRQQHMFDSWPENLSGEMGLRLWHNEIRDTWNTLQMSLFLSKAGQSWEEVTKKVENHRNEVEKSMERNARIRGSKKGNGILDMRARLYTLFADKAREEGPRRYPIPSQQRGTGKKLCWRDGNVSDYHGCLLNFLKS